MNVPSIHFVQAIPVYGTSARADIFAASSGWTIAIEPDAVVLSCRASENVAAVPAFRVRGVGYCVPVEVGGPALRSVKR